MTLCAPQNNVLDLVRLQNQEGFFIQAKMKNASSTVYEKCASVSAGDLICWEPCSVSRQLGVAKHRFEISVAAAASEQIVVYMVSLSPTLSGMLAICRNDMFWKCAPSCARSQKMGKARGVGPRRF